MTDSDDRSSRPHDDHTSEDAPTIDSGARTSGTPTRIGHYTVRRVIASGGMGTVLEATQDEPRRSVAIKILKSGIDSPEAMRRFQFEAQLLARLRHPGIAQIYEAGTHDDGSGPMPFFAMEYIANAKPITSFAESRKLDLRERLALFARVCEAVQHGHQRGIIHRDIKPGNILVDSDGNPRVIDFGVARATDSDTALTHFQTQVGQLIGSVAYMSPEQFEADPRDLDTRSDVYALGVVLYELIAGVLPYDVANAKIYDAARIIREQEPKRLAALVPGVPPEVETIVGKALEKDRERRYQSANGLAEDLRRFLSGQTIVASAPSAAYQLRVFARRHKVLIAGVAATFVVLVGAVIATSTLYLRAQRERARAEQEAKRSKEAVDFLNTTLSSVAPEDFGHEPSLEDLLRTLDTNIDGAFPNDPLVESQLRKTIGIACAAQGSWPAMEKHLRRAVELRVKNGGENDPETVDLLDNLANAYKIMGDADAWIETERHRAQVQERLTGKRDAKAIEAKLDLVNALCNASRLKDAQEIAEPAAALAAAEFGPDHEVTLDCRATLAWLQLAQGSFSEAEASNRALLETCRRTFGDVSRMTRRVRSQLAASLIAQGRLAEADSVYGGRVVPANLGIERRYQGDPTTRGDLQLYVFWETWCPFSQRTVPSLEAPHLRYPDLDVVGLTRTQPPSNDQQVTKFISDKGVTFPIAKTSNMPWAYFDVPGTPFIVLAKDKHVVWENSMQTPDVLLDQLLTGMERGERRQN